MSHLGFGRGVGHSVRDRLSERLQLFVVLLRHHAKPAREFNRLPSMVHQLDRFDLGISFRLAERQAVFSHPPAILFSPEISSSEQKISEVPGVNRYG